MEVDCRKIQDPDIQQHHLLNISKNQAPQPPQRCIAHIYLCRLALKERLVGGNNEVFSFSFFLFFGGGEGGAVCRQYHNTRSSNSNNKQQQQRLLRQDITSSNAASHLLSRGGRLFNRFSPARLSLLRSV